MTTPQIERARTHARYDVIDRLTANGYERTDVEEFLTPYDFEAGDAMFILAKLTSERLDRTYRAWYQTVKVNKEHERLMLAAALQGVR